MSNDVKSYCICYRNVLGLCVKPLVEQEVQGPGTSVSSLVKLRRKKSRRNYVNSPVKIVSYNSY